MFPAVQLTMFWR